MLTTTRMDGWFVGMGLVCVVGNHAMLHYVNGLTLGDEEEEKKEKME